VLVIEEFGAALPDNGAFLHASFFLVGDLHIRRTKK
jgi:hypothetical protein